MKFHSLNSASPLLSTASTLRKYLSFVEVDRTDQTLNQSGSGVYFSKPVAASKLRLLAGSHVYVEAASGLIASLYWPIPARSCILTLTSAWVSAVMPKGDIIVMFGFLVSIIVNCVEAPFSFPSLSVEIYFTSCVPNEMLLMFVSYDEPTLYCIG